MNKKVRWGILSTAKIATEKVIPAMQKAQELTVDAIASRSIAKANEVADELNIPKRYDSYEALLADPDIDAIYNPLPNHLHVFWTIKALEAGKHVLCEKPVGLNASEAERLLTACKKSPHLKVMEAFMYRLHPQWIKAKELVDSGALGELRTIHTFFSYYNVDSDNIRNKPEVGGGSLMDIGCYCISFPRFIFGEEPLRIVSDMDYDPVMKTDRLSSAMMKFPDNKKATFTCSTQLSPYQRTHIFGSKGKIEIMIPVNAPAEGEVEMFLETDKGTECFTFINVDQYTLQCDALSHAILSNTSVPTPLEDAVANMKVIDAIVESNSKEQWVTL